MQVVLHIGAEKTGTSTLQQWCDTNRIPLRRRGWLYPECLGEPGHARLACYATRDRPQIDLLKSEGLFDAATRGAFRASLPGILAEEIAASGRTRILVSNEHLSSRLTEAHEVQAIKSLIEAACREPVEWLVLYYVRRQDEMLVSLYSTAIKSGDTAPFHLPEGLADPRLNPLLPLELWAGVFGHAAIVVRVFERSALAGGDVVRDMMALLGIADAADRNVFAPVADSNQRLGAQTLEFLRRINTHISAFDASSVNADHRRLVRALELMPDHDSAPLATPEALARFVERFDAVNAEVARRYLGRPDGRLFTPVAGGASHAAPPAFNPEKAVAIAAYLWRHASLRK